MKEPRIQSFASLRREMLAVARGEQKAPAHAAETSFHSVDVIARILTRENRALMATIRESEPQSVAELAEITSRAPSNLTRTLDKLESIGLVFFETSGRRKAPRAVTGHITVEIDPFSTHDTIKISRDHTLPTKKKVSISSQAANLHSRTAKTAARGGLAVARAAKPMKPTR